METQNIPAIELVVVNLYPFEATIAKAGVSWDEAIEKIDIGGPAMVRAAAKNHAHVSVLTSPNQYERILSALDAGPIPAELRRQLALEAFQHTAAYDSAISTWLGTQLEANAASPHTLAVTLPQRQTLRYGENPHQAAAWYSSTRDGAVPSSCRAKSSVTTTCSISMQPKPRWSASPPAKAQPLW